MMSTRSDDPADVALCTANYRPCYGFANTDNPHTTQAPVPAATPPRATCTKYRKLRCSSIIRSTTPLPHGRQLHDSAHRNVDTMASGTGDAQLQLGVPAQWGPNTNGTQVGRGVIFGAVYVRRSKIISADARLDCVCQRANEKLFFPN